jgi:3-oxoadipate enol-lactonase
MERIKSDDAEIAYRVMGDGPPVVLLHPFPVNHEFWLPVANALAGRYRLILPDLRGHGESRSGEGPATMQKHAADIARVMNHAEVQQAPMVGVSIGGYALFEFWRQHRDRVTALSLMNTKASADGPEARSTRLRAAADVLEHGTEQFFSGLIQKLLGRSTRETRPDLMEGALRMMRKNPPASIAAVQRGMAERPDSIATLKTINVPVLLVTGDEDELRGIQDAELMRQNLPSSELKVVPKAGHYAAWEQSETSTKLLRTFLERFR